LSLTKHHGHVLGRMAGPLSHRASGITGLDLSSPFFPMPAHERRWPSARPPGSHRISKAQRGRSTREAPSTLRLITAFFALLVARKPTNNAEQSRCRAGCGRPEIGRQRGGCRAQSRNVDVVQGRGETCVSESNAKLIGRCSLDDGTYRSRRTAATAGGCRTGGQDRQRTTVAVLNRWPRGPVRTTGRTHWVLMMRCRLSGRNHQHWSITYLTPTSRSSSTR